MKKIFLCFTYGSSKYYSLKRGRVTLWFDGVLDLLKVKSLEEKILSQFRLDKPDNELFLFWPPNYLPSSEIKPGEKDKMVFEYDLPK